jgi:hypothetical protein
MTGNLEESRLAAEDFILDDPKSRLKDGRAVGVEKKTGPVLWWATLGLILISCMAWALINWVVYNFKPAPIAPGERVSILLIVVQIVAPLFCIVVGYFYVLRPWRKMGRLPWDAVFLLACATILFQDPINNYFKFTFSFDPRFVNFSSWAPWIPGWEASGLNNFSEPLFFIAPFCFTSFFLMALFGCKVLDWTHAKLPQASLATRCLILYVILLLSALVFEVAMVRVGLFTFSSTYSPLTLFVGHWYQFPLYEVTGNALLGVLLTLVRYRRGADGLSFVEQGISRLRIAGGLSTFVRWLALVGVVQVITFLTFFVPYNWISAKADSFPEVPLRYTYGLCDEGPGAQNPCPSPEDPWPGK